MEMLGTAIVFSLGLGFVALFWLMVIYAAICVYLSIKDGN